MTCTGCQNTVEGLLSKVDGVKKVNIDLGNGTADIEKSRHISTENLKAALGSYPKYQLSEESKPATSFSTDYAEAKVSWFKTYKPILLIFAYILAISLIASQSGEYSGLEKGMRVFMAGFFIIFSFFKLLDLNGFADSYSMYDLAAKKFRPWGYLYPFVELGLGLAYAANFQPEIINYITFVVMSVSIVGVLQSVLNRRNIQCACLGAVFNLPMSTVTIIEDALMIGMSVMMVIMIR